MANLSLVDDVIDELDRFRSTSDPQETQVRELIVDLRMRARDLEESELPPPGPWRVGRK